MPINRDVEATELLSDQLNEQCSVTANLANLGNVLLQKVSKLTEEQIEDLEVKKNYIPRKFTCFYATNVQVNFFPCKELLSFIFTYDNRLRTKAKYQLKIMEWN